jgi:hypothetical protein
MRRHGPPVASIACRHHAPRRRFVTPNLSASEGSNANEWRTATGAKGASLAER